MGAVTIQQMADRVAALMEQRLRIRGDGLAEKIKKGGGKLPRAVRMAAEDLAAAAHMSQNPKLLLQVDEGKVAAAYDICLRHLGGTDKGGRPVAAPGVLANMGRSLLYVGLTVLVLIVGLALWRGVL